jgi:metal-responsive CopG/Arc/MetJ family transcriptional regulator
MSKIRRIADHVDLTIMAIPGELLHEFSEYVIKPFYPGGISSAIMDLMRKAVQEQKQKERKG